MSREVRKSGSPKDGKSGRTHLRAGRSALLMNDTYNTYAGAGRILIRNVRSSVPGNYSLRLS